jgi:hypothetical protein
MPESQGMKLKYEKTSPKFHFSTIKDTGRQLSPNSRRFLLIQVAAQPSEAESALLSVKHFLLLSKSSTPSYTSHSLSSRLPNHPSFSNPIRTFNRHSQLPPHTTMPLITTSHDSLPCMSPPSPPLPSLRLPIQVPPPSS